MRSGRRDERRIKTYLFALRRERREREEYSLSIWSRLRFVASWKESGRRRSCSCSCSCLALFMNSKIGKRAHTSGEREQWYHHGGFSFITPGEIKSVQEPLRGRTPAGEVRGGQ